jgi:hypothetical protein
MWDLLSEELEDDEDDDSSLDSSVSAAASSSPSMYLAGSFKQKHTTRHEAQVKSLSQPWSR